MQCLLHLLAAKYAALAEHDHRLFTVGQDEIRDDYTCWCRYCRRNGISTSPMFSIHRQESIRQKFTDSCRIIVIVYLKKLGRPGSRWEENIGMDLKGIIWQGVECIDLAQDRDKRRFIMNPLMKFPFQ